MTRTPYMPFYFGDFLQSTVAWEGEEQALYMLLLAYQWASGPLPRDPIRIAKVVRYDTKRFMKLWGAVGGKFSAGPQGLVNPRLEEHRQKSHEISAVRSEVGRRGGAASAHARAAAIGQPNGEAIAPVLPEAKINHPIQSNPILTPPTPLAGGLVALSRAENGSRAPRDVQRASGEAWSRVLAAVRSGSSVGDPLIDQAVNRIGGYQRLGQAHIGQRAENKRRFREAFEEIASQQVAA